VDLFEEGFGDRAGSRFAGGGKNAVGACECVGDAFAHVTDDDLQCGQAVEDAGDDEAQRVEAGFGVPSPTGDREWHGDCGVEAGEVDGHDGGRWRRGVNVDGDLECGGGFEDGEEFWCVQELAVGEAVEIDALETELGDAAVDFLDGVGGLFEAGGAEGGEACGIGVDSGGCFVVDGAEDGGLLGGRESVNADGGERDDL